MGTIRQPESGTPMFCRLDDLEHVDVALTPAAAYSGGGTILPADSPPIVAPYRGGAMPTTMMTDAGMRIAAATIPGATYVDASRPRKAIPPVRRSVVSARPRERRSPCSTRRRKTASSASSGSSDPDLGEPPGACWRLREVLAAEVRWRLLRGRGASA